MPRNSHWLTLRIDWTAFLPALALLAVLAPSPARAQTASPDFKLAPTTFTGYLVRGGLQSCTGNCLGGLVEPKQQSCLADFTCTTPVYTTTDIQVQSVNGFLGTVNLEVLGLPPGVTSQTALSVTIVNDGQMPPFASTIFSLKADATAPLGTFTVTVRGTSGALSHTLAWQVSVVDQLPPLPPGAQLGGLSTISVDSQFTQGGTANVVGGTSTTGTVWLTGGGAGPGGLPVSIASSNPVATVSPSSIVIPEGASSAPFTLSAASVSAAVLASISATDGTTTAATSVTVWPPDTVTVTRAQYDASKGQLGVEATSNGTGPTLTVLVASTSQVIGTLQDTGGGGLKGQLSWPVNPKTITVSSNHGGSSTVAVAAR